MAKKPGKKFDVSFDFGANVKPKGGARKKGKRESRSAAARRRRYAKGG
jgi:hypothetical protein